METVEVSTGLMLSAHYGGESKVEYDKAIEKHKQKIEGYNQIEAIGLAPQALSLTSKLTRVVDGRVLTDTLKVAETFEKQHRDLTREIREKLRASNLTEDVRTFYERNMIESTYIDSQNRSQTYYLLTQAGFSFLALDFTGSKAESFKIAYIQEFEAMQEKLRGYALAHFLGRLESKQLVYVIKNPTTGLIKIGISDNIKRRVSQLQCASGCELEVVFCSPASDNSREIEKLAHNRFTEFRQYGEWFNMPSDLAVNFILDNQFVLEAETN